MRGARAAADGRGPRVPARASRARRGATSRRSSAPTTTACRPTTSRSAPELRIAHRTSPTNIGMGLLATLAAHDLGFIDTDELVRPDRRDADDDRGARAVRRPPAQLVRHADARAAAAALRLDGGQRQPRRRADDARVGLRELARRSELASPASRRARARAARSFDGMNFRFLYDPQAPAVLDRLPPGRRRGPGPARRVVLRPAGVRGAPRELRRHRQGRRAGDALVPPRPAGHERRRRADAAVVERHAVRVPDAAARDAELSGHAARRVVPHGRAPPDASTPRRAACRGASPSPRTTSSIATATTSTRRSASPASA